MNTFNLTRSVKPSAGPVIKRILVRCPTTGKLADTGKIVKEAAWARTKLSRAKISCPHCHQLHSWTKKDVILAR